MIYEAKVLLEMSNHYKKQTRENPASRWTLTQKDEDYIIYPYYPPPFLFRGQNKRYRPCHTSLLRGLSKVPNLFSDLSMYDQATILIRHAKICWFAKELDIHPIFNWAKQNKVYIDEMALAQHYELSTGFIDVSQSFEVAAFFATCKRDLDGKWIPVEDGNGVIYKIDWHKINPEYVEPVGLQPFPRPSEQWAWVIEVPMGYDFESHTAVSFIEFKHNEKVSNYFLDMFNGGELLFPSDPLEKVAQAIIKSNNLSKKFLNTAFKSFNKLEGGLLAKDRKKVFDVVESRINIIQEHFEILSPDIIMEINKIWESEKDNFGNSIAPIVVRAERRT